MRICLALAIGLIAAPSTAAPLWQNVNADMSWDQLKAARPLAQRIPPERKKHFIIHCTHMDEPVKVYETPYEVCYDLRGGMVNAVILHNGDNKTDQLSGVKVQLTGKYGKPDLDECQQSILGRECNVIFRKSGMWIRVSNLYFNLDRSYTLNIRYEKADDNKVPL